MKYDKVRHDCVVLQGPLSDWANRLTSTIKVAGASLDSCGYDSLGNLILETMKDCTASGRPARASHLVAELVRLRLTCNAKHGIDRLGIGTSNHTSDSSLGNVHKHVAYAVLLVMC